MGIPYVEAESEAEAQCAQMAEGKVQSLHSIFFLEIHMIHANHMI